MTPNRFVVSAALVGAVAPAAVLADTPAYNFLQLSSLGGYHTVGLDINDQGDIAGYALIGETEHAFRYTSYGFTELLGELPGGNRSRAAAINDAGVVVGYSATNASGGDVRAFSAAPFDNMTGLGTLGGTYSGGYSAANAVNNDGAVVGSSYYTDESFAEHAFLWTPGDGMASLGALGSDTVSAARGINDDGHVTGLSVVDTTSNTYRTFFYNGTMTDVGQRVDEALGFTSFSNQPSAISNWGTVIGNALEAGSLSDPNGVFHAFLYDSGSDTTTFVNDTLGGLSTTANGIAINDADGLSFELVVGASWNGSANRAYVYDTSTGNMQDLNTLADLPVGWSLVDARAINSYGQIVVTGTDGSQTGTFLLSPITNDTSLVTADPQGVPITVQVGGGTTQPGGVAASFTEASGTFSALFEPTDTQTLANDTAPLAFATPSTDGGVQVWEVTFYGSLGAGVTVTFAYDPSLLAAGINEADLRIYHYTGGAWVQPEGQSVDTVANTITIATTSFSPFALAVIPEPATLTLLTAGAACVARRRQV